MTDRNELSELIDLARGARDRAYAPYSNYRVGAAVRAVDGRIYCGCNVENAAYPQGLCAEAAAVAAMVEGGGREISAIAIVGPADAPVPPCGGCRQVLAEFGEPETQIYFAGSEGGVKEMSLGELLPEAFLASHLDRDKTG